MLVLSRKVGEKIQIGSDIEVTVVDISRKRIRLGINCPLNIPVHREEVFRRIHGSTEPPNRRDLCVFQSNLQFLQDLFGG